MLLSVHRQRLLIVPYGIETRYTHTRTIANDRLLIVPYGIETITEETTKKYNKQLLIVPYGIETPLSRLIGLPFASF